jgi:hypothetical protein
MAINFNELVKSRNRVRQNAMVDFYLRICLIQWGNVDAF